MAAKFTIDIDSLSIAQISEILHPKLNHNDCDVPSMLEKGFYPAAVLILLVCENGSWNILFTQRTNTVRDHKGQVSFPGGGWENTDDCLKNTALREAFEEIGIQPEDIMVFGSMPPFETISNFMITPFVGTVNWPYTLKIGLEEVESVFTVPFTWLMDAGNTEERDYEDPWMQLRRKVLFYKDYDNHTIWGITAMLTRIITELMK